MALKKYTLYYKYNDKKNNEINYPIISLDLKTMDKYTSMYSSGKDLIEDLPSEVKDFIKENFTNKTKDYDDFMFISDSSFSHIMDVILKKDCDVLYINEDEIKSCIINIKMDILEFQKILLKTKSDKINSKYKFFKYLYDTYVKGQKIEGMIDTYDTKRLIPNLFKDELMIASIATDQDNIKVLCKKLSQNLETRRNIAFKYKYLFKDITGEDKIISDLIIKERKIEDLEPNLFIEIIKNNFKNFKNKYQN